MSKLVDVDKLELDAEWSDYYNEYMAYSLIQVGNAEKVKAIPLDKVEQAREKIKQLPITDTAIKLVTEVLDELLESEEYNEDNEDNG